MSRDNSPPIRTPGDRHDTRGFPTQAADSPWNRLLRDLGTRCDGRPTAETIDEIAVARYLAGQCSEGEREAIERAIEHCPELRTCIEVIREALDGDAMEPAA